MKEKIIVVTLIVSVLLTGVYFSGAFYYRNKLPSNVYVNEVNLGGMTLEKSGKELGEKDVWDKVTVTSNTEEFLEIIAEEIEYRYVAAPNLPEIFNEQSKWKWFLNIFKDSVYTTSISSDYNKDKVKNMINGIGELDKELLDAKVLYSDNSDAFIIEPHSYEIKITKEELFDLVSEAIDKRNRVVNIEKNIQQPSIFDDDESLISAKNKANQYLNVKLKYDFGDREEVIDKSLLKNWITVEEKEVNLNRENIKESVAKIASKYDTYGRGRKFKTSTGKNIITKGGTYGWVTHRGKTIDELIEHIEDGEDKTIKPVYSFTALIRDSDDVGDSYLEIDLEEQMVYLYIKGLLRVKTQAVTGDVAKGYDTPPGVYPINYKETDAILKGENYAAPVEYWLPFNKNIGFHDAGWRSDFGGDIYENDGSHGCINLPPEDAKTIFELVYPGMPVIVH